MGIVLDVIDNQYKATADDIKGSLQQKGFSNFIEICPCPNIVREMVSRIMCRTSLYSITLLRIWGHGNSGIQCIAGFDCFTSRDSEELKPLGQYFTNNALVELHGCQVASAEGGARFIQLLADLWDVRVRASLMKQENMIDRTDWAGPVVEARPKTCGLFRVPSCAQR
jgi:hypothetical protein